METKIATALEATYHHVETSWYPWGVDFGKCRWAVKGRATVVHNLWKAAKRKWCFSRSIHTKREDNVAKDRPNVFRAYVIGIYICLLLVKIQVILRWDVPENKTHMLRYRTESQRPGWQPCSHYRFCLDCRKLQSVSECSEVPGVLVYQMSFEMEGRQ